MRHKLLSVCASLLILAIQDLSPQTARATSITVVSVDEDDRSATVNIFDNSPPPALPMVTIAANSPDASEVGPTNGQFTVSRTGATTSALTVNYAISGTATNTTDYATLLGSVIIAAGSATATVTVTPLVDALTEDAETVILTLSANAAYKIGGSPKGFKDLGSPDPTSTLGGNDGTTLGAQRLIAAQYAADLWVDLVSSKVPILVDARFDAPNSEHPDATDPFNSLDCTEIQPVIATAEPTTYHGNFAKAPKKNTWYPQALANSLTGNDLSTASDIRAYFNSSVGTSECLPDKGWYYGLLGNAQPDQFDFVTVVLRELAHGLGFITTVDLSDGKKHGGYDDVLSLNLQDVSTGKLWSQMTDAERLAAMRSNGNLRWTGDNGKAVLGGEGQMYAPPEINPDFSVSNWDGSRYTGSVTIEAGSTTALITVDPIDDGLEEGGKTVILSFNPDP